MTDQASLQRASDRTQWPSDSCYATRAHVESNEAGGCLMRLMLGGVDRVCLMATGKEAAAVRFCPYGGRLSLADGAVVGAQSIVSNGFGASLGLERCRA